MFINKNCILLFYVLLFGISTTKVQAQLNTLFDNYKQYRTLTERWELDSTSRKGTFLITPYKPIYILPTRWSSHPNERPQSDNPAYSVPEDEAVNLNNYEAKFQLSFKVKTFQGLFWGNGDLWIAYSQKSNWQVYNKSLSRPFREVNYEPEVILNFATNFNVLGFKTRMLGISFNHESNGRGGNISRSWNRVILQAGLERDNWSVYLRPWFRLPDSDDENPKIVDYMGRGEMTVVYTYKGNVLSFTGRHNLNFNSNSRGLIEFDWSYPISGNLKARMQFSHGYGETLIDYNNRQTIFGLGISLIEWL
ncbi:phospholipase A [Flavobacterium sp. '19STA2R22 D10 B1']|uniref:phospholipase A n=1 Tax=Flavobacterium aerium TaxID=3037261 RepID=UPI00278C36FD|nr:phospholipase A [Flavobacterium sp. '19STA2R22 D10 B1']